MTTNQSFSLLFSLFSKASEKSLWVLDENPPANCPAPNDNIEIISNRFDVVEHMKSLGYKAYFSDFKFHYLDSYSLNSYRNVFFRISKEKALAHFIINSARSLLQPEGQLIISGAKQEGIKGYIDRAAKCYKKLDVLKADKSHWAAVYQNDHTSTVALDDKEYSELREAVVDNQFGQDFTFTSKPGVFGWNKVDQGSKLLIESLDSLEMNSTSVNELLDLGCGYGYLSVLAAKKFNCAVTSTDNNAAAIEASLFNLKKYQIEHQVVAANCAQGINKKFELILCNPPFHTGFGVENDLTDQFLNAAKQFMNKGGAALFVVNLHIPLERKANRYFSNVHLVNETPHFKVIALR